MGDAIVREVPEVKQYIRVNGENVTIKKNNDVLTEQAMFVDDNFFNVFSFRIVDGNKRTALKDLHSVVLSRDMAKKHFGSDDVVGELMQIKKVDEFENYIVSAIVENPPQNSSIRANIFLPMKKEENRQVEGNEWIGGNLNTFLLLSPQANIQKVEAKIQAQFDRNTKDFLAKAQKEQGVTFKAKLGLQPLTGIHLSKKAGPDNGMSGGSRSSYSYILTCIAIFILVIACINFINLAVAQSLRRSRRLESGKSLAAPAAN
jgi:putative ABC transport system permease protein